MERSGRGFFLTQLEDLEHYFLERWKADSNNSLIQQK